GRCGTVASVATPGRPDSTALFVEDFNVEDMDGFLANYFLMALVIAVVTLIIAPNCAEAFTPDGFRKASQLLQESVGRNEADAQE
ncbi:hypothetical protein MTO96_034114, partial [Rhipicephalus appendiculatus]